MVHIAVMGTGRVGQGLAYTLLFERYVTKLSLVDTAPNKSEMVKEELLHCSAYHGLDVEIEAFDHASKVEGAELMIVTAGFPRQPGMDRRDLAVMNGGAIKDVILGSKDKNPGIWFLITNPVDAMATLAQHHAGPGRIVVSTGTNLETTRFRTILSRELAVPMKMISGYVGGEHGKSAVPLWSTVRIDGMPVDEYLAKSGKTLDKDSIVSYVKNISMEVIKALGGTRWGPAGGFIEIIRGVLLNTDRLLSYAVPQEFDGVSEPVHVTIPGRISKAFGPNIWGHLTTEEQSDIKAAAGAIYETYRSVLDSE